MARFAAALAVSACAALAPAVPSILIVREKLPQGVPALDVPICDYVANEFQTDGRLQPICWGLTDPIFRAAATSGKLGRVPESPSLADAYNAAAKFDADYVLVVDVRAGDGDILSGAVLYERRRMVWRDPNTDPKPVLANLRQLLKKKKMTKEEYDAAVLRATYRANSVRLGARSGLDDTLRSIARSWVEMLGTGPFRNLPKQHEQATPDPGKGLVNPSPTAGPVKADDRKWLDDANAALKAGDAPRALSILRDAVDGNPTDPARRSALIAALMKTGQPGIAAREARRSAELMPEQVNFRLLAGKAWIEDDNLEEAQVDLNEALARAPDAPETRILLATVAVAQGDFNAAIDHLGRALKAGPNGDALYLRALAHTMLGQRAEADQDAKAAQEAGLSNDPAEEDARYGLVAALFDRLLSTTGDSIRTLQQRAQVERTSKEVGASAVSLASQVDARTAFMSSLPAPKDHQTSHSRRVLAYKLLGQCLSDLQAYLKSGDLDVLTDSRINLGEALKQAASASKRYKDEQQAAKSSDAGHGGNTLAWNDPTGHGLRRLDRLPAPPACLD